MSLLRVRRFKLVDRIRGDGRRDGVKATYMDHGKHGDGAISGIWIDGVNHLLDGQPPVATSNGWASSRSGGGVASAVRGLSLPGRHEARALQDPGPACRVWTEPTAVVDEERSRLAVYLWGSAGIGGGVGGRRRRRGRRGVAGGNEPAPKRAWPGRAEVPLPARLQAPAIMGRVALPRSIDRQDPCPLL